MAENTNQPLFGDFPSISTKEWMDKITADLKGADFEKKLVWRTGEGFSVRPFYRSEDLENLDYLNTLPGQFPYVRGVKEKSNAWFVRQDIVVENVSEANKKALDILCKGVDSLGFIIKDEKLVTLENIELLLKGIELSAIELNFDTTHGNQKLIDLLISLFHNNGVDISSVKGSLNFDPIGKLAISGKVCSSIESVLDYTKTIVEAASDLVDFKPLAVNAKYFNNAGSTIVQELAFGLSLGSEYISQLIERGLTVNEAASAIKFNFGVGGNYFMEIAKLRAGRLLWAKIVEAYGPIGKDVCKMSVHSETSEWNKTIYDPNVNMLRTQTEAMSAALGGSDSITILPYDIIYKTPDAISERVARNQQLLLKEESHFDKIVDPSAGSYYIENLTASIADEAWKLFIVVEDKGGFIEALKEGFIQSTISETANKRKAAIATRRENLLGTNQYPNTGESVLSKIEASKIGSSEKAGDTIIEPLVLFRGSEEFEQLRLATEKATKRPKVFMLTYGNLAMRLARSQFSGNFFGCAGYEIKDNNGFDNVEDGVKAAKEFGADIIVLCSSDDEYVDAAPAAFNAINGEAIFVVAGAPACADDLKAKGITNFINVRSNVLETLQGFNKELGI